MRKDQSRKLESPAAAASRKRAKSSTEMATEETEKASRKKRSPKSFTALRCSQRIQNAISCTQGKDIEPVIETIDLRGSDEEDHKDKQQDRSYDEKKVPEEDLGIRNLEGKIDYLTLLLEAQEKNHEAKSMGSDTCFHTQNGSFADIKAKVKKDKYKQMYIDTQKKIVSMQEENRQLAVKLEIALGKIEAYEKGHSVLSGTIERLKDAMLVSTLTKTTEMMFGFSIPRANSGDCAAPTAAEAKVPEARTRKNAKSNGN